MKKDIHPQYFPNATWTCACGAVYNFGSTKETIQVEVCANCHPFYTGTEKISDTAGRVEKFKQRKASASATVKPKKAAKKAAKAAPATESVEAEETTVETQA
jgi:large subunit ribosomal protein L31